MKRLAEIEDGTCALTSATLSKSARQTAENTTQMVTMMTSPGFIAKARTLSPPAGPVFLSDVEASALSSLATQDSLIGRTLRAERTAFELFLEKPIHVPGSGPGGGPAHEAHKLNYQMIFSGGRLWQIFRDERYPTHIRALLLAYAEKYESLPFATPNTPNPPGRLFHQILNEHMWLLFSAAGYGSIRQWLSADDRQVIEDHLFSPMVDMFARTYAHHFDIIHNHGMWASSAVGIAGLASGRHDWLALAIHGQNGDDSTAGFLAQLSGLFSPSGYYEEGPYYQRFAIQPMLLFAEALERTCPALNIYEFNDRVIRRGFYGALSSVLPDGTFLPLNDALKRMNVDSLGYVIGASTLFRRYGPDRRLLWLAERHGRVWLDVSGGMLSQAVDDARASGAGFALASPSAELTCGENGEKGAIGILRAGDENDGQAVASLDYGTHGLEEHAHFDGLTLGYFAGGHEILRDYGSVRWINMEPKNGGSYLPENISFAKQTIAHNTVTVDETAQNDGDGAKAMKRHGERQVFSIENPDCQVMSGMIREFDPGVTMKRTIVLVRHPDFEHPVLIDLFRIFADHAHQYDYSLYYDGQIVRMDERFDTAETLAPLSDRPGYRHLWKRGEALLEDGATRLTWMQDSEYVSLSLAAGQPATLVATFAGANDPQFNLRPETGFMVRVSAQDAIFASVVERHGVFDEARELSARTEGLIAGVSVLHADDDHAVLALEGKKRSWRVVIALKPCSPNTEHSLAGAFGTVSWQGQCAFFADDAVDRNAN